MKFIYKNNKIGTIQEHQNQITTDVLSNKFRIFNLIFSSLIYELLFYFLILYTIIRSVKNIHLSFKSLSSTV